jgi:hypothetical protein
VLTQKEDTTMTNVTGDQATDQTKTLTEKYTDMVEKTPSIEIGSHIHSITPLQYRKGNMNAEVVFIEDLTPISASEMPPSELFFNKKRRVVVKRETHQKEGEAIKRHWMLLDGGDLGEAYFALEVAGLLGAFSTENQF